MDDPPARAPHRKQSLRDEAILAAVRRGDARVVAEFYRRITPIVERTVSRLFGRSDSDREDLVQIASVQIIESLPTYRSECPLDSWVSAVSANVVYKYIRRRRLERRVTDHLAAMRADRAWAFVLHVAQDPALARALERGGA